MEHLVGLRAHTFQPTARFFCQLELIPAGEAVDFTDLSIGVPSNWAWIFEGAVPQYSTEQNPKNITYPNPGIFQLTLTVSNQFGQNTITKTHHIEVCSTLLPEVSFTANKRLICTGEMVEFTDHSLHVPRQWLWEFNPGTVSFVEGTSNTSPHPRVIFHEPGSYNATLIATNLNGSASSTTFDIVNAGGINPPYIQRFNP
jgi:PKD repeat protein